MSGQAEDMPGQAADMSGQVGEMTGQAEDTPGQAEDMSRQAEEMTRWAETCPDRLEELWKGMEGHGRAPGVPLGGYGRTWKAYGRVVEGHGWAMEGRGRAPEVPLCGYGRTWKGYGRVWRDVEGPRHVRTHARTGLKTCPDMLKTYPDRPKK